MARTTACTRSITLAKSGVPDTLSNPNSSARRRWLANLADRISAFDCILPQPIPDKGSVLTQISRFWFDRSSHVVRSHCISADPDEIVRLRPELEETRELWAGRGMLVEKAEPFPIECVVRGYITGSAWKEYRDSGTLAGEPLAEGLVEAQELEAAPSGALGAQDRSDSVGRGVCDLGHVQV